MKPLCDGLMTMITKLDLHGEEVNSFERRIVDYEQSGRYSGYFCSTTHGKTSFVEAEYVLELHLMTLDPGGSQFPESAWGQAKFLGPIVGLKGNVGCAGRGPRYMQCFSRKGGEVVEQRCRRTRGMNQRRRRALLNLSLSLRFFLFPPCTQPLEPSSTFQSLVISYRVFKSLTIHLGS